MAGLLCYADAPAVALAAATAKTVWSLKAAANVCLKPRQLTITFNGADATKAAVKVEICQWDAAGSGTKTDITVRKADTARAETPQLTAQMNYTAEPTALVVVKTLYIPQYNGGFAENLPIDAELIAGGKGLAVRCTSPDAVSCSVSCKVEE